MLFNEILKNKYDTLEPVFDELFELVIKRQTHSGDLLLVTENAHFTEEPDHDDGGKVKVFYNIGPGMDHHCETASHDFIKQYIRGTFGIPYDYTYNLKIYCIGLFPK